MAKKLVYIGILAAVILVVASSAANVFAATPTVVPDAKVVAPAAGSGSSWGASIGRDVTEAVIYSILGLVILLVGFKALDFVTPFSLNKEIAEDDNTAAGVVVAGMMVALGIIIAAAIG